MDIHTQDSRNTWLVAMQYMDSHERADALAHMKRRDLESTALQAIDWMLSLIAVN
jgi:hypothetical protein